MHKDGVDGVEAERVWSTVNPRSRMVIVGEKSRGEGLLATADHANLTYVRKGVEQGASIFYSGSISF